MEEPELSLDDIRKIDFERLERDYNMAKYYPKNFHNDSITTPILKELLLDKPIYKDANKHVKRRRPRDREARKEVRAEHRAEKAEARLERKVTRIENRQVRKIDRQVDRIDRQINRVDKNIDKKIDSFRKPEESEFIYDIGNNNNAEVNSTKFDADFNFNNITIVPQDSPLYSPKNRRKNVLNKILPKFDKMTFDEVEKASSNSPRGSISKFVNFMKTDDPMYKGRANSFDQTKSAVTSKRKWMGWRKEKEDVIGMYKYDLFDKGDVSFW